MRRSKLIIFLYLGVGFLSACSQDEAPKLLEMQRPAAKKVDKHKNLTLTFKPAVDILFVVDNSGSMSTHQSRLSTNASSFTNALFSNVLIDYHIGITTSDMDPSGERGDLVGWVDKSTPNISTEIQRLLVRGISGSATETFFEPVIAALSPPKVNGVNDGFYRKDAFLAIVFVTDSVNNGPMTADGFYKFLVQLKGFNEDKILAYAAFIPPGELGCTRDPDGEPFKILDFLTNYVKSYGVKNYFSLCSNFGLELARIGEDLENRIELFVPFRGSLPVVDSIEVKYGTQMIPKHPDKGWSWNTERRGLRLGRELEIQDQPGAELSITYIPANLNQK